MAYKDAATNTTVIAAALDPRFRRLKFLCPDESLKLQMKVQALALEAKRRVKESQRQKQTLEAQTSAGVTEKRSVSLLDTLLGSNSEETSSQNDNGDEADVISHSGAGSGRVRDNYGPRSVHRKAVDEGAEYPKGERQTVIGNKRAIKAALPLFIPAEETKLNSIPRAREVRSIRPSADLRCNHETHRSTA
ncbi:unnamed protein product [Pleuronectes platessa]|uniref:Uncharacterized protein n=1 Tax=Pleuronectes platessa TaxID=8262 RepID=A0A9N7Y8L5_PLEPL|nr:unnamed protein product [Pleuronectes platessa]